MIASLFWILAQISISFTFHFLTHLFQSNSLYLKPPYYLLLKFSLFIQLLFWILFIFSSFFLHFPFIQFSLFQNYFISLFSLSFLLSIVHWEFFFNWIVVNFYFELWNFKCDVFSFLFSFNCCLGDFIFAFVFLSWMPACSLKLSKFLGFGKAAVHVHAFWIAKCNMTKMNFIFPTMVLFMFFHCSILMGNQVNIVEEESILLMQWTNSMIWFLCKNIQ